MAGCAANPSPSPVAPDFTAACSLNASSASSSNTVVVALLDSVHRSHALSPKNDSELLLYRMTRDTPLRLDCEGKPLPGFAASWDKDPTGRLWTLTLKDNVNRSPGSPLTAYDVVAAWNERPELLGQLGLRSAAALDERRIVLTLARPQDSVPELLADPALALDVDPSQLAPGAKFELQAGVDPRDALDRGADLVVTRDRGVVEYAARQPGFTAFALPWSRTYVLLEPAGSEPLDVLGGAEGRRSLARDVASADARPTEPPFWWNEAACSREPVAGATQPSTRVGYTPGDEVARGLAERIVALAGPAARLSAAATDPADLAGQLRTGSVRAYVGPLPRRTLAPCRELAALPGGVRIEPLIDTRAHAILRRGAGPLSIDWDGTIRVAPR